MFGAADAVLGGIQRDELDLGMVVEQVDRGLARPVDPRVVRDGRGEEQGPAPGQSGEGGRGAPTSREAAAPEAPRSRDVQAPKLQGVPARSPRRRPAGGRSGRPGWFAAPGRPGSGGR